MYICELDACETTESNYAPKGQTWLKKLEICMLYAEIELNIDDWTFLMAIKGQGDPLIVKLICSVCSWETGRAWEWGYVHGLSSFLTS